MLKFKNRNKKGQIEDWLPLLAVLVLMLLLFFILLFVNKNSERKEAEYFELEQNKFRAQQVMIDYARSPYSEDSNIADKINEYHITRNKQVSETLIQKTKQFFEGSEFETSIFGWSLKIIFPDGEEIIINTMYDTFYRKKLADLLLPTTGPSQSIKIELSIFMK